MVVNFYSQFITLHNCYMVLKSYLTSAIDGAAINRRIKTHNFYAVMTAYLFRDFYKLNRIILT